MTLKPMTMKRNRISFRMDECKIKYLQELFHTDSMTELFNRLADERINQGFNLTVDKPPISAMGGKHMLSNRIIKMIPPHAIYVEPFANTAAVLLRKPPSQVEVYNDIDKKVSNFYRVLREQPIALYNACISIPYSEQVYREIKGLDEVKTFGVSKLLKSSDPIHMAAVFFFISHTGWFGKETGGFTRPDRTSSAKAYLNDINRFVGVSERLRTVDILCGDYRKVVNKYGKYDDSFFFVDPPYLGTDFYYDAPFGVNEHRELSKKLLNINGKFLICHYSDRQINKYYKDCYCKDVFVTVSSQKSVADENGVLRKPRKVLKFFANYDLGKLE